MHGPLRIISKPDQAVGIVRGQQELELFVIDDSEESAVDAVEVVLEVGLAVKMDNFLHLFGEDIIRLPGTLSRLPRAVGIGPLSCSLCGI